MSAATEQLLVCTSAVHQGTHHPLGAGAASPACKTSLPAKPQCIHSILNIGIKPTDCRVGLGGFNIEAKRFDVNSRFLVMLVWAGFSGCALRLAKTILSG